MSTSIVAASLILSSIIITIFCLRPIARSVQRFMQPCLLTTAEHNNKDTERTNVTRPSGTVDDSNMIVVFGFPIIVFKSRHEADCTQLQPSKQNLLALASSSSHELRQLSEMACMNINVAMQRFLVNVFLHSFVSICSLADQHVINMVKLLRDVGTADKEVVDKLNNLLSNVDFCDTANKTCLFNLLDVFKCEGVEPEPFGLVLVTIVKKKHVKKKYSDQPWVKLFRQLRNRFVHHSPYFLEADFEAMISMGYGDVNDKYATIYYKFFEMLTNPVIEMDKQVQNVASTLKKPT